MAKKKNSVKIMSVRRNGRKKVSVNIAFSDSCFFCSECWMSFIFRNILVMMWSEPEFGNVTKERHKQIGWGRGSRGWGVPHADDAEVTP